MRCVAIAVFHSLQQAVWLHGLVHGRSNCALRWAWLLLHAAVIVKTELYLICLATGGKLVNVLYNIEFDVTWNTCGIIIVSVCWKWLQYVLFSIHTVVALHVSSWINLLVEMTVLRHVISNTKWLSWIRTINYTAWNAVVTHTFWMSRVSHSRQTVCNSILRSCLSYLFIH